MKGDDVVCVIKNAATLAGALFTLHASQIRIDLPTLSEKDKQVSGAITCLSIFSRLYNLLFSIWSIMVLSFDCNSRPCYTGRNIEKVST